MKTEKQHRVIRDKEYARYSRIHKGLQRAENLRSALEILLTEGVPFRPRDKDALRAYEKFNDLSDGVIYWKESLRFCSEERDSVMYAITVNGAYGKMIETRSLPTGTKFC